MNTSTAYIIIGLSLIVSGVLSISAWVIRTIRKLAKENEGLKSYVVQQDKAAVSSNAILIERINELQQYINTHDLGSANDNRSRENVKDESSDGFPGNTQWADYRHGRHAYKENIEEGS